MRVDFVVELNEVQQPVNKHRETQLKLQEKLREKLLHKQNKVSRYRMAITFYFI